MSRLLCWLKSAQESGAQPSVPAGGCACSSAAQQDQAEAAMGEPMVQKKDLSLQYSSRTSVGADGTVSEDYNYHY